MSTENKEQKSQDSGTDRIMSFSKQRVVATFAIFLIVFAFTTAILWDHIDDVMGGNNTYLWLARAGLVLLPVVALLMTVWELFVDKAGPKRKHPLHPKVVRLIDWCFWGGLILLIAELVHSGALLKYKSSAGEQQKTIAAVGAAQAQIAKESTTAAIETASKQAKELNAAGQRRTAAKVVALGGATGDKARETAQTEVTKVATTVQPKTFLPEWYVNGGMYTALPILAALFFGITMALARQAQPYVDANDDGVADHSQGQGPRFAGDRQQYQGASPMQRMQQEYRQFHSSDPRLVHLNGMPDEHIWESFQAGNGKPQTRAALADHYGVALDPPAGDDWLDVDSGKSTHH